MIGHGVKPHAMTVLAVLLTAAALLTACGPDGSATARPGATGSATPTASGSQDAPPVGESDGSSQDPSGAQSQPPSAPGRSAQAGGGSAGCTSVKVIGARGTGEAPGLGYLLSGVARQIDAKVSKPVTSVGLDYPASSDFTTSAKQGTTALNRLVAAEKSSCLVLLGYSQGAIVVGETLAAIGASGGSRIVAVVLFGDPRFNGSERYDAGTFAKNSRGTYPRPTGQLSAFASRMRSYCNGGDTVCQGPGASGKGTHLEYGTYTDDAARFVAARV